MQHKIDQRIKDEARTWFMKITSEEATDDDIENFELWRREKPDHQAAYVKVSRIGGELSLLSRSPQGENLRKSLNEKHRNRGWARVLYSRCKTFLKPRYMAHYMVL